MAMIIIASTGGARAWMPERDPVDSPRSSLSFVRLGQPWFRTKSATHGSASAPSPAAKAAALDGRRLTAGPRLQRLRCLPYGH